MYLRFMWTQYWYQYVWCICIMKGVPKINVQRFQLVPVIQTWPTGCGGRLSRFILGISSWKVCVSANLWEQLLTCLWIWKKNWNFFETQWFCTGFTNVVCKLLVQVLRLSKIQWCIHVLHSAQLYCCEWILRADNSTFIPKKFWSQCVETHYIICKWRSACMGTI